MTDPMSWRSGDGHPDASTLLLLLEGDLDAAIRAPLHDHVQVCWVCRAECDRMNRGISRFVEYWEGELERPLSQPPKYFEFARRLNAISSERRLNPRFSSLRRVAGRFELRRLGWLSAAILASVGLVLMLRPPKVSAAELLYKATAFRSTVRSRPAYLQKVRLSQGSRVAERDVLLPGVAVRESVRSDSLIDDSMVLAGIDPFDPLNPLGFSAWRNEQFKRTDSIVESENRFAISTTSLDGGPVESATLTLSRTDWRSVSEIVVFKDRPPLEITELSYAPFVTASSLGKAAVCSTGLENRIPASRPLTAPASSTATADDLNDAEIQLREVFHRLDVDRNEAPRIWRTAEGIHYEALFDTGDRKQQVAEAVRGIPFVSPADPYSSLAAPDAPLSNAQVYTSNPPLAKSLWDYFGGMDSANTYLAAVRNVYFPALSDASALQRLADRYPDAAWQSLSRGSQARLDRIARDYIQRIELSSDQYLAAVTPVLDEVGKLPHGVADTKSGPDDCEGWRVQGPIIFTQLRKLQTAFQGLFVITQSDTPLPMSADVLLRDASGARVELQEARHRVCQP